MLSLLMLACLTPPGDANEGSVTGSCPCGRTFKSSSPPRDKLLDHLRKYLREYKRCQSYVRFQLQQPWMTVCGGSRDPWVLELVSCVDGGGCGYDHWKSSFHQVHPLPRSTLIPEPTVGAPPDLSSPAWILSTQQPTLPPGATSLDTELTHHSESTTRTAYYSLRSGSGSNAKQHEKKEQEGEVGASAVVPVLSLLATVFFLTGLLLYVLCKRRAQPQQQHTPDLQLHYTSVTQDSNA